jgi:polyisoprenoid-binding protein YceI
MGVAMLRVLVLLVLLPVAAAAAPWRLDPETSVAFDVAWQGGTVEVRFPGLGGEIDFDATHPERARAVISVSARDATTGIAVADALLRSDGYLAADRYPTMTFRLDRLVQTSKQTADIFGSLTLRGVTRPLAFQAQVFRYGPAKDDPARFDAGFDLTGRIDRTEFGSTGGVPEVASMLPIRIRLLMHSQ